MTREELIEKICPSDNITDCCSEDCLFCCDDCKVTIDYMLDEYDKQIKADTINEFVTRFEEEYSRIAVNLGEFRKYQYEMHRLAENMVKEQKC